VAVSHLDQTGVTFSPVETNAPPVVNADAVLALPIPGQLLKTIAGRYPLLRGPLQTVVWLMAVN